MLNVGTCNRKGSLRAILDNDHCGVGELVLPRVEKPREARLSCSRHNHDSFHPQHRPPASALQVGACYTETDLDLLRAS